MNKFTQKLTEAFIEVLIREISERSVTYALNKSKEYIKSTIEKGRKLHNDTTSNKRIPYE